MHAPSKYRRLLPLICCTLDKQALLMPGFRLSRRTLDLPPTPTCLLGTGTQYARHQGHTYMPTYYGHSGYISPSIHCSQTRSVDSKLAQYGPHTRDHLRESLPLSAGA